MTRRARVLIYIGPMIAWMGVIFYLSTRAGGTNNSYGLIIWFLRHIDRAFLASLNDYQLYCLNYALRKFCHVSEYFVLSLLALRALRQGRYGSGLTPARLFLGAAGIAVLFAVTDEFHQMFVGGRSPSYRDVLIDSGGAVLAMAVSLWFHLLAVLDRSLNRRLSETESDVLREEQIRQPEFN